MQLSASEEATFATQLSEIVDYIDQLRTFDAGAVIAEEVEAPSEVAANDVPRPADPAGEPLLDRFLDNAPASLDRFLLVPQVKATPGSGE